MRRVIINSLWMMADKIYILILSLVIGSFASRYLGPSNFGLIDYGASFVAIASAISTLGIDATLIKRIVSSPKESGSAVGSALAARAIASFLLLLISNLIAYTLFATGHINLPTLIVISLQSLVLVFSVYEIFTYYFQAMLDMQKVTIAKLGSVTAVSVWKIILLLNHASIFLFAFSTAIEAVVCLIAIAVIYSKVGAPKLRFNKNITLSLIRESYPLIFSKLMIIVYMRIDRIMLGMMISTAATGIYAASAMISTVWSLIPLALIASLQPLIMTLKDTKKQNAYEKRLKQLFALTFYFGIVIMAVLAIAGPFIISVLFGNAYAAAYKPLLLLTLSNIIAILGSVRGIWLVCEGKLKYNMLFTMSGAFANIMLNLALIPKLGISGSALATIISQVIVVIVVPFLIPSTRASSILLMQGIFLNRVIDKKLVKLIAKNVKNISKRNVDTTL